MSVWPRMEIGSFAGRNAAQVQIGGRLFFALLCVADATTVTVGIPSRYNDDRVPQSSGKHDYQVWGVAGLQSMLIARPRRLTDPSGIWHSPMSQVS